MSFVEQFVGTQRTLEKGLQFGVLLNAQWSVIGLKEKCKRLTRFPHTHLKNRLNQSEAATRDELRDSLSSRT